MKNRIKHFFIILGIRIGILLARLEFDLTTSHRAVSYNEGKFEIAIVQKSAQEQLIDKLVAGDRDQQFVKDFYEILKKADEYVMNSSAEKMSADMSKWGMSRSDEYTWGDKEYWESGEVVKYVNKKGKTIRRRVKKKKKLGDGKITTHEGYFDPKSRNYGKTLREAMKSQVVDRVDDEFDYEVEFMVSAKSTRVSQGFTDLSDDFLSYSNPDDSTPESINLKKVDHNKKRAISVYRENKEIKNKIEDLTDYLHIKKMGLNVKLLEFFIPLKYKVFELEENSTIFKELIENTNIVYIYGEYGENFGYKVGKYHSRKLESNEHYGIIRFTAELIEKI